MTGEVDKLLYDQKTGRLVVYVGFYLAMTLLIDADWLIYNSCCACEQDTRWNDWEHTLHSDERDILNLIENRLDVYKSIADSNDFIYKYSPTNSKHDIVMCFTSYPTFRHEIFPEYKINRIGKRKPLALKSVIKEVKKDMKLLLMKT